MPEHHGRRVAEETAEWQGDRSREPGQSRWELWSEVAFWSLPKRGEEAKPSYPCHWVRAGLCAEATAVVKAASVSSRQFLGVDGGGVSGWALQRETDAALQRPPRGRGDVLLLNV